MLNLSDLEMWLTKKCKFGIALNKKYCTKGSYWVGGIEIDSHVEYAFSELGWVFRLVDRKAMKNGIVLIWMEL